MCTPCSSSVLLVQQINVINQAYVHIISFNLSLTRNLLRFPQRSWLLNNSRNSFEPVGDSIPSCSCCSSLQHHHLCSWNSWCCLPHRTELRSPCRPRDLTYGVFSFCLFFVFKFFWFFVFFAFLFFSISDNFHFFVAAAIASSACFAFCLIHCLRFLAKRLRFLCISLLHFAISE